MCMNESIQEMTGMMETSRKAQERQLHWYGCTMRRHENYVVRRMLDLQVESSERHGGSTLVSILGRKGLMKGR